MKTRPLALALLALTASCAVEDAEDPTLEETEATAGAYQFFPTGLEGAGFQNVVAVAPGGSSTVLAGADVAGFHRSADRAVSFEPSNRGNGVSNVAAILFHPTIANKVYGAVGRGQSGNFLVSTNGGASWSVRSTAPNFNGGNTQDITGEEQEHPRSTGNLIALDRDGAGNETIYVATFSKGVMRSTDDGATWTTLGLAGEYLRSIAVARSGGSVTVYAAAHDRGVWRWTPGGSFQRLAASPATTEEIVIVGGTLYVAAHRAGVFRSTDGGVTFQARNVGLSTAGPKWQSIAGYVSGTAHILYAGCAGPAGGVSLVKSTDSGASWTPVMLKDSPGIHYTIAGPTGQTWWLSRPPLRGVPAMMPGNGAFVASHIAIDPASRSRVYVAGRSGIWATTDGGGNWYPMVSGLGVTVNMDVVTDPRDPANVFVGNMDWTLIVSTDGMSNVYRSKHADASSVGYSVAIDSTTNPSTIYVAAGERDHNRGGGVFATARPDDTASWTDLGLPTGNRPIGVAVGMDGSTRVVLAAVENAGAEGGQAGAGGVYRRVGTTWTKVAGPMTTQQTSNPLSAEFAWLRGTAVVYLYDRATGVWRSSDAGRTWSRIWSKPATFARSGNLAIDPAQPSRLYVSASDGVYRLDSARTGTAVGSGITATRLGAWANPGAIAVHPTSGQLYAVGLPGAGASARVGVWDAAASTWRDVADDLYRSAFGMATSLTFATDGTMFVTLSGSGLLQATQAP